MSDRQLRWSELHHGIDPAGVALLGNWLRLMWMLARPFVALRVPPTLISVAGAVLALSAVPSALQQPLLALVFVLLSVLCDGLDGAIALLADRASRSGAMADAVCDRIADLAFAAVIWRCGAPLWLAGQAAITTLGLEGVRLRRGGALRSRLTVAERPTRVVCAALALLSAAVSSAVWTATVCAAVWAALSVVGIAQLSPWADRADRPG